MRYRTLGTTGITVSEIGFGAWGIGGPTEGLPSYGPTDDSESLRTLEEAFDRGITLYDTSDLYGRGRSERLIGEAFHAKRERVVIATKVGLLGVDHHDLSPDHVRTSLDASLRRLQTDYIDMYQVHSPPLGLLNEVLLDHLRRFQEEGKIRAYGLSVKHPNDGIPAVERFGFGALQANFSMIDQRIIANGFVSFARKHNVGLIARTPFNYGFLTGATKDIAFGPEDHRSQWWSKEQLEAWTAAPDLFSFLNQGKNRTPAHLALQFCLGFPEISSVIPGMMHPAEVIENAATCDLPPLDQGEIALIQKICNAHFSGPLKK